MKPVQHLFPVDQSVDFGLHVSLSLNVLEDAVANLVQRPFIIHVDIQGDGFVQSGMVAKDTREGDVFSLDRKSVV